MSAVLAGRGLHKRYGARTVVDHVSLEVRPGEVVGLLGPNGAGKTTALRILAGVLASEGGGRVELGGDDVTRIPLHERVQRGLGYLPQEPTVFRSLSALQNVVAYLEAARVPRARRIGRAEELLGRVGLGPRAHARAGALSGGERRRLEVARTMALTPRVVLLDEPFTGVDPRAASDIALLIRQMAGAGVGVLLCDHAAHLVLDTCDRGYVLDAGCVRVEGTVQQIRESDVARGAYLGSRAASIIEPWTSKAAKPRSITAGG